MCVHRITSLWCSGVGVSCGLSHVYRSHRRNTLAEDTSSCPGSSTRSGSLGVYPHSPSVHVASLHIGNWYARLCIPCSYTGWLVTVTSCITSAYIYMSHAREMMAEGTVGNADPGPRAIEVENTAPFGAPVLPAGYVFSDWLRRAAIVNLCMAVRPLSHRRSHPPIGWLSSAASVVCIC